MNPYYALGYRAGQAPCGMAMMPFSMTEQQEGDWISGFLRAATDMLLRAKARVEPEVAVAMKRNRERAG